MEYIQNGDYLIPNFVLPTEETKSLGKYAMLRKSYLKQYRKGLCSLCCWKERSTNTYMRSTKSAYFHWSACKRNGNKRGRGWDAQGERPNGMGTSNEQHTQQCWGDRPLYCQQQNTNSQGRPRLESNTERLELMCAFLVEQYFESRKDPY